MTLPDLLRYQDLAPAGLSRYRLDRLIADDVYERIAPGVFLRAGTMDDTTAAWTAIAAKRPEATICLLSALALHDLTDEIPTRSNVAVPRGVQPVTTRHASVAWHRFDPGTFTIGRNEHHLPTGLVIGLYSQERTIIDLFRLRHEWGSDLAIGALRRWLRQSDSSPATLLTIAREFPKSRSALQSALEVLL